MTKRDHSELLHWPRRADCMESLEVHLNCAARLSRALWEMLQSENMLTDDNRTNDAALELANVLADQTSAALFRFYKDNEKKSRAANLPV